MKKTTLHLTRVHVATCALTVLLPASACFMVSTAHAQSTPAAEAKAPEPEAMPEQPEDKPIADGHATRDWMQRQASRKQASTIKQTLSGPVMDKVHERYVDSFNRAVPDRLRDNTPTSSK